MGSANYHARIRFHDGSPSWLLRVLRVASFAVSLPSSLVENLVLSEYATLKFLETITVPAPRALGYGICRPRTDHGTGVSFILMEELRGTPWIDKPGVSSGEASENEKARVWRGVADILMELEKHPFPKAGSLCLQSSEIEVSAVASDRFLVLTPTGPFATSTAYYTAFAEQYLELIVDGQLYTEHPINAYLVYRFLRDNAIQLVSQEENQVTERFYLKHVDDKGGHLLVDEQLNITGIIDWQMARIIPRHEAFGPSLVTADMASLCNGKSSFSPNDLVLADILRRRGLSDLTSNITDEKDSRKSRLCAYATTPYGAPAPHPSQITATDVNGARSYCAGLLQKFDSPSYVLQTFIPASAKDAYLAIRALNIELARIPDLVSNPTVGALRMQFWRDNLTRTFAGTPPKEPVAILLHTALQSLRSRHPGLSTSVMKGWFMRIVNIREQYMDNRPFTTIDALETYAENTYSTLLYLTLATIPLNSMSTDHVASHIGKATGIAAILRGLPLLAFPPPPNHHSNNAAFSGALGGSVGGRQGAVVLPLEVMAEAGVREEDIYRQGADAPGLRDAVFTIATRANDHLITAGEMLKNLKQGEDAGHAFEHEGEDGHQYAERGISGKSQIDELEMGFGVLMPAVSTRLWLEKLEKNDFDIFKPELRAREWKLPWKSYLAYSRRTI
ncbi:uncharacterized protein BP5553_04033 [Venustampulla echinocandica]|uniref:Aminoglycoside phosphotransferase domain-containing protein n=1 Tax=Venustampulla echinocandica TaxID=2656787 RepID=A0A370TVY1_9HELO|nr:uncharacterized protein BP5553_04033 [Venustampulla echinocandica]RDL39693.1 hypothetical protein BP5553_04033 [Venustampulla echinocandica]